MKKCEILEKLKELGYWHAIDDHIKNCDICRANRLKAEEEKNPDKKEGGKNSQ